MRWRAKDFHGNLHWIFLEAGLLNSLSVFMVAVAQSVESQIVILVVAGSSPVGHPIFPIDSVPRADLALANHYRKYAGVAGKYPWLHVQES